MSKKHVLSTKVISEIVKSNQALWADADDNGVSRYWLNLMHGLEGDDNSPPNGKRPQTLRHLYILG